MKILFYFMLPFLAYIIYFYLILFGYAFKHRKELVYSKQNIKKNKYNFLNIVFWYLPKQVCKDLINKRSDDFTPSGIILFTGEQGQGKTISMVQYALELKRKFPKCSLVSNTPISSQDFSIKTWRDITKYNNGRFGSVICLDELGLWINSKNQKDLSADLLQIVAQNRKNRRVILATAQQYYQISKDARTQIKYLCECRTILNCLTFVFMFKPLVDEEGTIIKKRFVRFYYYLQDSDLRNSYDTYAVIHALSKTGFIERTKKDE